MMGSENHVPSNNGKGERGVRDGQSSAVVGNSHKYLGR